ncbi:MAG: helix-turn-helix domain-containing protein [Thermodesulfovibrionales bacterium]|nr:helix-turn-helix domain-containing protein [Thermodesulfovibrionales bacterium]
MSGKILEKRREELGYNLKEIAKTLRIRADYLKAIEEGTFEKLPLEVYAKGYIREYAKFLKTDPEAVIKAYIEKISPPVIEKQPEPITPAENTVKEEKPYKRYSATAITLSAAAATALLAVLFLFVLLKEGPKTPLVGETSPVLPAPQSSSQTQGKENTEETKKEILANSQGDKTVKEHILEILASDKTWILAIIDNTESKELLLNKGESAKLSAKNGFSLKIGNAGGIKLIFDGNDMGAPGENGKVITLNLPSDKNFNR